MLREAMAEAELITTLNEAKNRFEVLAKSKGTHQASRNIGIKGKTEHDSLKTALKKIGKR
jgi:hypothetical protein